MAQPSRTGEGLIQDLAEVLEIPVSRYESADRSYRSVSRWLDRPESRFADVNLDVYTQGSFRLGTAIRPLNGEEHYDLDIVCEFRISKAHTTQKQLYDDLGHELELYAAKHGMQEPSPWQRCWTLNYADEAQFHMDVLPSVPDAQRQRVLREARSLPLDNVDKSVSITDTEHANFRRLSDEWPASNPNGYADWFQSRMKPAFESRRRAMMLAEAKADVADIPVYRVKTPLQSAIQILKRHRDMRFADEPERRPTSIVITTLAAHAYQQETTISGALLSILQRMDSYIVQQDDGYWIANPSDPRENFADAWNEDADRRDAFYDWLETARADFSLAASQQDPSAFVDALAPRIGRGLVEAAVARRSRPSAGGMSFVSRASRALQRVIDAPHRKPATWPTVRAGTVEIIVATAMRDGFRPRVFTSDDAPVPPGAKLRFDARTDVPRPFRVYWQVVNTGAAATAARNLRGGFDEVTVVPGVLSRTEDAKYPGSHSIECFVVKDGHLAARSGPFLVNIG